MHPEFLQAAFLVSSKDNYLFLMHSNMHNMDLYMQNDEIHSSNVLKYNMHKEMLFSVPYMQIYMLIHDSIRLCLLHINIHNMDLYKQPYEID